MRLPPAVLLLLPTLLGAAPPSTLLQEEKLVPAGGAAGDYFAATLGLAGDVNDDGFDDVIAGAWYASGGAADSGAVWIQYGGHSRLDAADALFLYASDGTTSAQFGRGVDGAGDVDGDGIDDVIVGAPVDSDADLYAGSAYVYLGSEAGLDAATEQKLLASDASRLDSFGYDVAGPGDLDGDGYADVVVGAGWDAPVGTRSGSLYVYYGSSTGVDAATEQKVIASDAAPDGYFGMYVSRVGDVNGDGHPDLLVGSMYDDDDGSDAGAAYLFLGSTGGLDTSSEQKIHASDGAAGEGYGTLGPAGDLDADGYADLVIGAYEDGEAGTRAGAAYVYYGSADTTLTEEKLLAWDARDHHGFGVSVSGVGDLDGDGYDDLVVGASYDADATYYGGAAYVFSGGPSGMTGREKLAASDPVSPAIFGYQVAGGDLDGDGIGDVVVGAPRDDDNGASSGSIYVYTPCTDTDGDGACDDADGDGSFDEDDCDDTDPSVHPGAAEVCDGAGVDEDCDGLVDDADSDVTGAVTSYVDADGDTYGDPATAEDACIPPEGRVADGTDCDDTDAAVNPGAAEVCDVEDTDEDCDTLVDDADDSATGQETWHPDADADTYGDPDSFVSVCDPTEGLVADDTDCDDTNASVHPGAEDPPGDGLDQDCVEGTDTGGDTATDTAGGDTGPSDTDDPMGGADTAGEAPKSGGECGCGTVSAGGLAPALLGALALVARRRRPLDG